MVWLPDGEKNFEDISCKSLFTNKMVDDKKKQRKEKNNLN